MLNRSHRAPIVSVLVIGLVTTMLTPMLASARGKRPAKAAYAGQDKKDKKSDKKDEQPKASKEEAQYQKIKVYSQKKYDEDADFRGAVDEAYRDTMRKHAQQAYLINTRRTDGKLVTRDGDKIIMEDMLYDNPLAQDYVNRVGQSLVPVGSSKLYAFKITLNPVPDARALSTGTIYVSSGLLSAIDNEAQLAYVLGHEIGHVEKEHWKEDVLVDHGVTAYNEGQQKRRTWLGIGIQAATFGIAGASGASNSLAGSLAFLAAYASVPTVTKLVYPNVTVTWDKQQEDQADELGLKYMLARNYDPNEVPKFFANLKALAQRDPRVRSGFMADTSRVDERKQAVSTLLTAAASTGSLKTGLMLGAMDLALQKANGPTSTAQPQPGDGTKGLDPTKNADRRGSNAGRMIGELSEAIKEKLNAGELIGTTAEFEAVMASLNRDNGITAYYFDMFQMARDDLEESLRIRSNDPYAHFYYGKVLKLTSRTTQEKLRALSEFASAVQYDKRGVLAEPHLYQALSMIDNPNTSDTKEIVDGLKQYVVIYQREHAGTLPANIDAIYDYMQNVGEMDWAATPAMNVSTKNIEPIGIRQDSGARPPTGAAPASIQPVPANQQPGRKRP